MRRFYMSGVYGSHFAVILFDPSTRVSIGFPTLGIVSF